jgi:hypothetical protein
VCGQSGGSTGARNQTLGALLWLAIEQSRLPLKLFDSSAGFLLPDGSVPSPDASVLRLERWQTLSKAERDGFPPLCPDLVVVLAAYMANGGQFGLAVAATKPHGGGVEGRSSRNSQLSPGVHRSGTAGGGTRVSGPDDRSASDLGGLRAISTAAPTQG